MPDLAFWPRGFSVRISGSDLEDRKFSWSELSWRKMSSGMRERRAGFEHALDVEEV